MRQGEHMIVIQNSPATRISSLGSTVLPNWHSALRISVKAGHSACWEKSILSALVWERKR
jgi:hypothetical protein